VGISPHMGGKHHNRPAARHDRGADGTILARERAIADLAASQHGVVKRRQLVDAGLSPRAIDNRLRARRLHALYRGVYLLGHAVAPRHAHEMAAVLASGRNAVVSHHSAAYLWCLLPSPSHDRDIDITIPARDPGTKPGIRTHRVRTLDRRDARSCDSIPVTTPARTLLDLAAQASPRELEQALAVAERRGLVRRRDLRDVLGRAGRRHGTALLRSLIEDEVAPPLTRSEAEVRLLALIRAGALPEPEMNVRIRGHEVDFLWRKERFVVEVDGFGFHSSQAAFERDRLRDAELQASGLRVMRVTWRQLTRTREATLARIASALAD
jgi:very-short-patch-repair endonuclease